MKVIVPMAGRGSRFSNVGYDTPKPLIQTAGKPMILWALESLKEVDYDEIIFIVLKEHEEQFNVSKMITSSIPVKTSFVFIDEVTDGQLCTVLCAKTYFDGSPILIAASDTYIVSDISETISTSNADGIISVANLEGDQWSFAKTQEGSTKVIDVAEKTRISDWASTGLYYFSDSKCFCEIAEKMIQEKETTKGEYYIMPLYKKYLQQNKEVIISKASEMWDMGTPNAKEIFEAHVKK